MPDVFRQRLQLILDSIRDPVIVVDIANREVTANSATRGIEHSVDKCLLAKHPCEYEGCAFQEIGGSGECSIRNALQLQNYSAGFFRVPHFSNTGTAYLHSISTPRDGFIVLHMKRADHLPYQGAEHDEYQGCTISHHDALTGLPNIFFLNDLLQQEIVRAVRQRKRFAVMFVDISRFNLINSAFGRDQGDIVLQTTAQRIRHAIRASDILIRQGGDTFIVIVSDVGALEDIMLVAKKIHNAIALPISMHGQQTRLKSFMGISIYPEDGISPEMLIKHADTALQSAKSRQQAFFMMYQKEMEKETEELLLFESRLLNAIEGNEFRLCYQPLIETGTGRLLGAEALIRWHSPDFGVVSPAHFIPLAEKIGVIKDIGTWVIQSACSQMNAWAQEGLPPITVSVNVSVRQLRDPGFCAMVSDTLREYRLPPSSLCCEITENILMDNPEAVIVTLQAIRDMGVALAIDDFGTGFSSLNYLKRLPVDKLKIDRSFISNITLDEADAAIVRTVISLAHNFKLKVNAEGVETLDQVNFLRQLNCDEIQGYFFSRPLAVDDFKVLWINMLMLQEGR